jgi:hypothetical protein
MKSDYLKFKDGLVIRKLKPHEKLKGQTIFEMQSQDYFLEFVSELGLDEEIDEFPIPFEDKRIQFFFEIFFLFKEGTVGYTRVYDMLPTFSAGHQSIRQGFGTSSHHSASISSVLFFKIHVETLYF